MPKEESYVSIGQVKRDISDLVNRVAYGSERVVLTSRGKPKAVLVSVEDYQRKRENDVSDRPGRWRRWLARTDALVADIAASHGGDIDVDELRRLDREDLESRTDWITGRH